MNFLNFAHVLSQTTSKFVYIGSNLEQINYYH